MPLSNLIKSPVLLFWIKRYLGLMAFSTGFRFFECLYFYKLFIENGITELLKSLAIGFMFDSCVTSLILAFIFILTSVFPSTKTAGKNLMIAAYVLVLTFNVFNFLHVVNFGLSFNYYSLSQLNGTVVKTIVTDPQFYIGLLGLFFVFFVIKKFTGKQQVPAFTHWKTESLMVTVFLFLGSFLFLPFPLYYYCNVSANSIINELPKNGLFSYVSSVKTILVASDLIEDTQEISLDKAIAVMAGELSNVKEIKNGKIIRTVDPDTNSNRYKHVILIIMESMGSNLFNDSIAPCLFKLKEEGLYYTKCKATGPRTQMAVSSLLTGVPNIIGINYYRRKGLYKIETLADYLTPLNYNCYYLHNGYLEYDNIDKLLLQGGFKNLTDANSMSAYKQKNSWGVDDEALYIKAIENINETGNLKTFQVLQTITNHEPFDIPQEFIANNKHIAKWDKKLQTYYYADYMAGKFLNYLKSRPDFDSTIVFITGDHGEPYQDNDLSYKVFHVPLIVLNGKLNPQAIDDDCSHIDIPYTILSACGYTKETVMFGENLFSLKPNRAIMSTNYNAELNLKIHDTVYRYSFEKKRETLLKLNDREREEIEIKRKDQKQMERMKTIAFARYKVVRDYLLSGKINRQQ
jgi:phosphoglycerol transferase MdoB-like AlkP superfamily enzyme